MTRAATFLRNWVLAFVTPRPLVGALYLPRYLRHWREYARQAGQAVPRFADAYPCLGDWTSVTPFDPHYFYQGAWLARRVAARKPSRHVDVGSSALTLSVLSATTETLHLDYRPLEAELPGLRCLAGDILALPLGDSSAESLSCLHVIEHIGLGRYGDPIDPEGSRKAARELVRVLAPGGRLYLSTPVGRERICFNAHRVFAPETVLAMFAPLRLEAFALVDDAGAFHAPGELGSARGLEYGCGMFELSRAA
jgi:SAM-dependent methyltransferase